jgi:LmbE family N-acetylglucosaminyl deacetylase
MHRHPETLTSIGNHHHGRDERHEVYVRPVPRRLLGVWAHPDDEAYLSAGLMGRVVDAGGQVTIVTATRGERGTDDPDLAGRAHFGAARERELTASLAELGVTDLRFLGLGDGECDTADDEIQVSSIGAVIRETHPDAIVTFGPDGITNHADHRAVSRWVTEAWRRDPAGELLYAAVTRYHLERFADVHAEIGVYADFGPAGPPTVERRRVALDCALDEDELDRKRRALAAHASQTDTLAALMGEATYRIWWQEEVFRRPTMDELFSCPVPTWMTTPDGTRDLAGSAS